MSIRKLLYLLVVSAEVMALSACSRENPSSVIAGPEIPVVPPLESPPMSVNSSTAFIWSADSGLQLIPKPSYAAGTWVSGINNRGEVAGYLILGQEDFRAFIWSASDGMRRLGSLIGAEGISKALTIDDNGEVRGLSEGPSTSYFMALTLYDGFVWHADTGMKPSSLTASDNFKPVRDGGKLILPPIANCMQLVRATTGGLAIGYAGSIERGTCKSLVAVEWESDGTPAVISRCEVCFTSVSDINNRGEVVGFGGEGGFRWTRSGGFVSLPESARALLINDNGDALGVTARDDPSKPFENPFVMMASGEIRTIDLPQGTSWVNLAGINNRGQVTGTFR